MQLSAVGPTRIKQVIYQADKGDATKLYRHDFEEMPPATIRGGRMSFPVVVKPDKGPNQKETGWLINPRNPWEVRSSGRTVYRPTSGQAIAEVSRLRKEGKQGSVRFVGRGGNPHGYPKLSASVPVTANTWAKVPIYEVRLKRTGVASDQKEASTPEAAVRLFRETIPDDGIEHIAVAFVNTRHRIIGIQDASRGTIDASPAFPREIAKAALAANAKAVILGHNHPSGDLTPSRDDLNLTEKVNATLKSTGVNLLDHVIFTHETGSTSHHSIRASSPTYFNPKRVRKNPPKNQTSRMIGRQHFHHNPILSKGGEMLTARKTRSISGVNHYVVNGPSSASRRSRSMVLGSEKVYPNPRHRRGSTRIFINPISKSGAKVWLGRAAGVAAGVGVYFLAEWGLAKLDFFAKVHPSFLPLAVAGAGVVAGIATKMIFKNTILALAVAAFPVVKGLYDAYKAHSELSKALPPATGPATTKGLGYLDENQLGALPPGSMVQDDDGNMYSVGGNQIADVNQIANFPMAHRAISGFPISRLADGRGIVRNF